MDQKRVDAGAPRRAERIGEDLLRLVEIDVAHHVEGAVEIAVADGRNEDIADLAVIDAGNLLRRLCAHRGRPWGLRETVLSGVDRRQEFVDGIGEQIRGLH